MAVIMYRLFYMALQPVGTGRWKTRTHRWNEIANVNFSTTTSYM